jgi:hypothetical protein
MGCFQIKKALLEIKLEYEYGIGINLLLEYLGRPHKGCTIHCRRVCHGQSWS